MKLWSSEISLFFTEPDRKDRESRMSEESDIFDTC